MGFGEASLSHPSKAEGAFPGAEDLLYPAVDLVEQAIPCGKPSIGLALARCPDTSDNETRLAVTSTNRFSKYRAPIGAVGKDRLQIVRERCLATATVMGLPGVTGTFSTSAVSASAPTGAL